MGPHGPEVLAYDLVRTVLRDDRFVIPKGGALLVQGITSGEVWDIVVKLLLSLDGAAHHRQRRLVSKAFTPKAAGRLRTTCADIIAELVYQHAGAGRCDAVADIARRYPIPIICALLGAPREDWHLFSTWATDIFKVFDWNVVNYAPLTVGGALVLFGGWYLLSARRWFTGPVREVDIEEEHDERGLEAQTP